MADKFQFKMSFNFKDPQHAPMEMSNYTFTLLKYSPGAVDVFDATNARRIWTSQRLNSVDDISPDYNPYDTQGWGIGHAAARLKYEKEMTFIKQHDPSTWELKSAFESQTNFVMSTINVWFSQPKFSGAFQRIGLMSIFDAKVTSFTDMNPI